MAVIVKIISAADGSATPHDGRYLVAWDPHVEYGTLALDSTNDPQAARQFSDAGEVLTERSTISNYQPIRYSDGEPNRPLRSIVVQIINTEKEK